MSRKRKQAYPSFYGRNAARNAERRYMKEKITRSEKMDQKRMETVEIISKHIQLALLENFGVPEEKIRECAEEVNITAQWYMGIKEIQGEGRAKILLEEKIRDFLPDSIWVPIEDMERKRTEDLAAIREATETATRFWCAAIYKTLGYGKEELTAVIAMAKENYRQGAAGK